MGFIRGVLIFIASLILFFLFLGANIFLTLSLSLDYETIQPKITPVIKELFQEKINITEIETKVFLEKSCKKNKEFNYNFQEKDIKIPCNITEKGSESSIDYLEVKYPELKNHPEFKENFSENYEHIEDYCLKKEEIIIPFEDYEINISCEDKNNTEKIINNSVEQLIEQIYYKDYRCDGFMNCIKQEFPFYLISKDIKNYYNSVFYLSLILILITFALIVLLYSNKTNSLITAGVLLIISSLPFMKLAPFLSLFSNRYVEIFSVFFSQSYTVFLISLFIGLGLIILGILLKMFNLGMAISGFIEKVFGFFERKKNKEEKQTNYSKKQKPSEEIKKEENSKKENNKEKSKKVRDYKIVF